MIDVKKQILYWLECAASDYETADILIRNKKYMFGLFCCHLTIEKTLKALVVKSTENIPPKTHDLFLLLRKAGITLSDDQSEFLGILMKYQLEGRYPDYPVILSKIEKVNEYFIKTRELFEWLKTKLM